MTFPQRKHLLVAFAIAVCGSSVFADQKTDDSNSFVRMRRDRQESPIALETAIVTFAPVDVPAKMPSSRAMRRVMAIASSVDTVWISEKHARTGVTSAQFGVEKPQPPRWS